MGFKTWVKGAAIVVSGYIAGNEIQNLVDTTPQENNEPDIENITAQPESVVQKDSTISLKDAMRITPDATPTVYHGVKQIER